MLYFTYRGLNSVVNIVCEIWNNDDTRTYTVQFVQLYQSEMHKLTVSNIYLSSYLNNILLYVVRTHMNVLLSRKQEQIFWLKTWRECHHFQTN